MGSPISPPIPLPAHSHSSCCRWHPNTHLYVFVVVCLYLSGKVHSAICFFSKPCTVMPLVSCPFVCLFSRVPIHHKWFKTHNDWIDTNWNSSLPQMMCFSSMHQQSNPCIRLPSDILFSPTHHMHIVPFTLAVLNNTRDTSNDGLSFTVLSASPIVCFSSSSSSFTRYSAASVKQEWVSKQEKGETKQWCQTKAMAWIHHSLLDSDALLLFPSLFLCSAVSITLSNSSLILFSVDVKRNEKSELLMDVICVSSFVFTVQIESSECCVWFQWFTQWCCSSFSNIVLFMDTKEKSELLMDAICVIFLLSSLQR